MSSNGSRPNADLAPHSIEAEEAVVGGVLVNSDGFYLVQPLKPEQFFIVRHGWIWEAMSALAERGEAIDYLTVQAELEQMGRLAEIGGAGYLLLLINKTPNAYNIEGYAGIVRRMAVRRGLINAASQIARAAHSDETDIDNVISKAQDALHTAIAGQAESHIVQANEVANIAADIREEEAAAQRSGGNLALSTGIEELDWCTDYQIRLGRYVSILGASGHFKTSIAGQIAAFWTAVKDIPLLYVSQEMPPAEVYELMVRSLAFTQRWTIQQADKHLRAAPLSFISRQQSVTNISAAVRSVGMQHRGKRGVVVIDTLNKLTDVTESNDITRGMTKASAALDGLKLATGWMVVSLIQQYIETNTTDPVKLRPSRNNIKNAKAPYEDSDVCFGVYYADHWRHEYGNAFEDMYCPKEHLLIKGLKTRKGELNRARLLKVLPHIPAFIKPEFYETEKAAA
jgi:replicative DNA helicase